MSDDQVSTDGGDEADSSCIWQKLEPSSSGLPEAEPAGRCGHVAVSSGNGKRLVVFGGYNAEGILSDVWDLDLENREWSRVNLAAGPSPPQRAYFRGCAGPPPPGGDARAGADTFSYVFGGTDAEEGNASNDLWCLDVERRSWHAVHPGGSAGGGGESGTIPCARSNHSMCRMNDVLVVHGGESRTGSLLSDLWIFDTRDASWTEDVASPRAGPSPCPRSSHCLAYAGRRPAEEESRSGVGSLCLFGGLGQDDADEEEEEEESGEADGVVPLNDLWVLSPVCARGLLDGGAVEGRPAPVWSLVLLDGVGPSPRSLAALTARTCCGDDGSSDVCTELLLFGGYGLVELPTPAAIDTSDHDGSSEEGGGGDIIMAYIDDLWLLRLEAMSGDGVTMEAAAAVSSSTGWVDEEAMGFAGPSTVEGRNGHTLTLCGDRIVLFGGFVGDGFDAGVQVAEAP